MNPPRKRWTVGQDQPPVSARFSADGASLALVGADGEILLRSADTGAPLWMNRLPGDPGRPSFSEDSRRILVPGCGTKKNEIRELDAASGRELSSVNAKDRSFTSTEVLPGTGCFVSASVLHHRKLSPENRGDQVLTTWVGGERILELRRFGSKIPEREKTSGLSDIRSLAVSASTNQLVVGGDALSGRTIEIYSLPDLDLLGGATGDVGTVCRMDASANGAAVCAVDQQFCCLHVANLRTRSWAGSVHVPESIVDVCFVGDSEKIATACGDGKVRLWSTAGPTLLSSFVASDRELRLITSDRTSRRMLTSDERGELVLWEDPS